jgi:hypothetical protein
VSWVGLGPEGEVAGDGAVEISTAEDPWAIVQGMRSGESQGARRYTDEGGGLAKVEPGFNAVCRLTIYRDPIAGS